MGKKLFNDKYVGYHTFGLEVDGVIVNDYTTPDPTIDPVIDPGEVNPGESGKSGKTESGKVKP